MEGPGPAAEALASVEETISALSYAEQAAGIRNRHRVTEIFGVSRVDLFWGSVDNLVPTRHFTLW